MMTTVRDREGADLGYIDRYTQIERKTGRWAGHGTVERVYWRAIPFDTERKITYHRTRRDALATLRMSKDTE